MRQLTDVVRLLVIGFLFFARLSCVTEEKNEISEEPVTIDRDLKPLLLTPLIKAGKIEEAQNAAEVRNLNELKGTKSYSGYLTVNEKYNSNMFFWFLPSQNDYENAPLVLWLQGGPGRSSIRGLLMENGPFDIGAGYLEKRKATWTQNHSVIYLDNPVGAGFSYTESPKGYHTNLSGIGEDLYSAILQFFQLFPNLQKHDFYIAGQSYGGKYVPTISHLIHKRNPEAAQKINLVGLAIGNGLVDPEIQLQYSEYLYQVGLINSKGKKALEVFEQKLLKQTQNKEWSEAYLTYAAMIISASNSLYRKLTGFNNVVSILNPYPTGEKEMHMSSFVSRPSVREAIHAGNSSFHPYNGYIQYFLSEDMMQTVAPLLTELINNYKVLIYNGQLDIIIPYRTTVNYLMNLRFNGAEDYETAERHRWYVNKELAGYATQVGNLTEVMVRNAGHSVPEDQIEWATDMLYRFTRNKTFN